jgi:hypothetical protein
MVDAEAEELLQFIAVMNAASTPAESVVMRKLTPACNGSASDRMSWSVEAIPACQTVRNAVAAAAPSSEYGRRLAKAYMTSLQGYEALAVEWIANHGEHTPLTDEMLVAANDDWNYAVTLVDRFNVNRNTSEPQ